MKQIEIFILKFLFIGHHSIVPKKTEIFVTLIPGPLKFLFNPPRPPILARINRVLITFIKLADRIEFKNTPSPSQKYPLKGLKTACILSKYGPRTNFNGADRLLVLELT